MLIKLIARSFVIFNLLCGSASLISLFLYFLDDSQKSNNLRHPVLIFIYFATLGFAIYTLFFPENTSINNTEKRIAKYIISNQKGQPELTIEEGEVAIEGGQSETIRFAVTFKKPPRFICKVRTKTPLMLFARLFQDQNTCIYTSNLTNDSIQLNADINIAPTTVIVDWQAIGEAVTKNV